MIFYLLGLIMMHPVYPHWKLFLPGPFVYFYSCDKCSLFEVTKDIEMSYQMASIHNKEFHKKSFDCAAGAMNVSQYQTWGKEVYKGNI